MRLLLVTVLLMLGVRCEDGSGFEMSDLEESREHIDDKITNVVPPTTDDDIEFNSIEDDYEEEYKGAFENQQNGPTEGKYDDEDYEGKGPSEYDDYDSKGPVEADYDYEGRGPVEGEYEGQEPYQEDYDYAAREQSEYDDYDSKGPIEDERKGPVEGEYEGQGQGRGPTEGDVYDDENVSYYDDEDDQILIHEYDESVESATEQVIRGDMDPLYDDYYNFDHDVDVPDDFSLEQFCKHNCIIITEQNMDQCRKCPQRRVKETDFENSHVVCDPSGVKLEYNLTKILSYKLEHLTLNFTLKKIQKIDSQTEDYNSEGPVEDDYDSRGPVEDDYDSVGPVEGDYEYGTQMQEFHQERREKQKENTEESEVISHVFVENPTEMIFHSFDHGICSGKEYEVCVEVSHSELDEDDQTSFCKVRSAAPVSNIFATLS